MIIVKMMGNIGNQFFIYAMARALQLETGDELIIDLSGLKSRYYTAAYQLTACNLPKDNISYDIKKVPFIHRLKYKITTEIYHLEQRIFRAVRADFQVPDRVTGRWHRLGCYFNFNRTFYPYPATKRKYKYVYGYFQSPKYFEKYEDVIREELQIATPDDEYEKMLIEDIKNGNSVAVSVRAQIDQRYFDMGYIRKEYYYEGMKRIADQTEKPVFYIFADYLEKAKETMDFPFPVTYVTPKSAAEGIKIMSSCNHFVIANSTFSWWGAFLGGNKEKVIIMPKPWDRTEERLNDDDLVLGSKTVRITGYYTHTMEDNAKKETEV